MSLDTWKALLAAYIIGGITFIPLIVIAIGTHAYLTLPYRFDIASVESDNGQIIQDGDDTTALDAARAAIKGDPKASFNHDIDVASGYFAVHREYQPTGINAKPMERSPPATMTSVLTPSPSVYQTMYRSIFDRKPATGPLDGNNSMNQRPKKAGNIFYVVLRHGHLMLFDDEEQLEVRHVISLSHHDISIYSGGDATPEGELFIKRNAICLSRRPDDGEFNHHSQTSRPFYLFSENCSAKEDFYFALLKNQQQIFGFENTAPKPKLFELKSIISLVQKLHSSEDQVHYRWLNAVLGRIFLGIYRTSDLKSFITEKITKKISRVKKPSFLTNIKIQKIDTGEAAPYMTNIRLKDLTVEGECVVEADVKYTGNFRIEVAATARIDLGTRFKAREVNLVLAVVLKKLEGHVLFKIKQPPSNRVWISFQTMPKLEMAIEPVVSSRQITYTVIIRQIESRIKEVFAETLVQPFWDDTPFFKTEHKRWRGGIFEGDDAVEPASQPATGIGEVGDVESTNPLDMDQDPDEVHHKGVNQETPILDQQRPATGLAGRRQEKNNNHPMSSASSTSVDLPPLPTSRSPNIVKVSTEPVVSTETTHADVFKPSTSPPDHAANYMAALHSRSQDASPLPTSQRPPMNASSTHVRRRSTSPLKNAPSISDTDGEIDTIPGHGALRQSTSSYTEFADLQNPQLPNSPSSESFKNQTGSLGRGFFLKRENSSVSTSANSADSEASAQKRNTLAAVTNAAAQARQWGWNAIQRQREAMKPGERSVPIDLSQPMGRGQPISPLGMNMPSPTNASWRKPVPSTSREEQSTTKPDDPKSRTSSQNNRPTSQRRRRRDSQQYDNDQNMLVVAAPDESQPATPASEGNPNVIEAWDEPIPNAQDDEAEETVSATRDTSSIPQSLPKYTFSLDPEPTISKPIAPQGSLATELDDDDFSAWIDE